MRNPVSAVGKEFATPNLARCDLHNEKSRCEKFGVPNSN